MKIWYYGTYDDNDENDDDVDTFDDNDDENDYLIPFWTRSCQRVSWRMQASNRRFTCAHHDDDDDYDSNHENNDQASPKQKIKG